MFSCLSGDPMLRSHVGSLRSSSGHSGPFFTLRTDAAAHSSLPSPHSPVVDASIWATVMLAVVVRCVFYGVLFFFLPVTLPSEITKLPTDPPVRGFPTVWKLLLLHTLSPRQISIPKSFVSVTVFYILSYLLLKRMGCLSGAWCTWLAFRSCFVKVAQHSDDLLMNL